MPLGMQPHAEVEKSRGGFFVWNAFAAGYAYAKAVFEFQRASWGVKRRASRVGKADFTS